MEKPSVDLRSVCWQTAVTDSFLSRLLRVDQASQLLLPHHLLGGNMDHSQGWGFICLQSNHCRLSLVVSGERLTRKAMSIIHVKSWQQGSLGPLIYSLQLQKQWSDSPRDPSLGHLNWSRHLPPSMPGILPLPSCSSWTTHWSLSSYSLLWPCQLQCRGLSHFWWHFTLHSMHPFQPSPNPVTPARIKLISGSFAS